MKNTEMTIKTPRGTFRIHTIFDSREEARENGWSLHFDHEGWGILNKDNRSRAVIKNNY